jgi:hypothetical protein
MSPGTTLWNGGPSRPPIRDGGARTGRRSGLLFLLLVFALPLHATLTSSAITGRVVIGETPAAGITVTATSAVLQHPRTTVTGPRGTYWLGALPPGEYDVTFSRAGLTSLTRRAVVELARVEHADARLEESADEESVTSTATTNTVAGTTAITSHFDDATLDRFPGRDYAASIAPDAYSGTNADIDGAPPYLAASAPSEDVIEQVTIVRGASPVEYESYGGRLFAARTRAGREQYFLSIRDTVSNESWNDGGPFGPRGNGLRNLFEANGGGRIISQRLWFFAALWSGDDATRFRQNQRGLQVKLYGQLGAAHHFDAIYLGGESDSTSAFRTDSTGLSLRHTGSFGPHLTTESIFSRASAAMQFPPVPQQPGGPAAPRERADFLSSRASYFVPARFGDHVLTAGVSAWDSRHFDTHSFFLSNRWSTTRWVVNAGLRYDDVPLREEELTPRIAVTYDVRGDGTHAIAASYGKYAFGTASSPPIRVAALGYAAAIGIAGIARIDWIRRGEWGTATDSLQLDTRYRLFDRFEAGATYTYTRLENDSVALNTPSQVANAWIGAQLPVGTHEFGVTVLQRYVEVSGYDPGQGWETITLRPTDFALRYGVPLSRVGLLFAADVSNAFQSGTFAAPRTVRFWVRARV